MAFLGKCKQVCQGCSKCLTDVTPSMEPAESSGASTPPEREPVMECCLVLTTLSGVTLNVSLSIAKFDRFADLEDHVMDYLISVTDLKVLDLFGGPDLGQTATE